MKHAVVPFPFGAREGELVVQVSDIGEMTPVDAAGYLASFYRGGPVHEVWLPEIAAVAGGGRPHKLGLELRRAWKEIVITAPVEAAAWPWFPCRLLVDVSEYLSRPVDDLAMWADSISKVITANPAAAEIYAIAPAPEMLDVDYLHAVENLSAAQEGATLYVAEEHLERAVRAAVRCGRPWAVRRLDALPPTLRVRAPAASPVA